MKAVCEAAGTVAADAAPTPSTLIAAIMVAVIAVSLCVSPTQSAIRSSGRTDPGLRGARRDARRQGATGEGIKPNGLFAVLVLRRFADPTLPVPSRIADPR
ncbi:hypothetical protein ATK86_6425 [Nocardia fluminea]|uniref:Uncharacterized protein n=1 Tax=Nocardia fluminea TaxID=134984 RepID=A0A2N3VK07_9NOCA|nr:hypothetical protein ATK86_6425 [Nocardia fluminea]